MSLSDFMPYGAPELLEGASPRMARSTFAASALVASLVWCLGLVAANRPVLRTVQPDIGRKYAFEPKLYEPKRPEGREATRNFTPPDGEMRPVVDEIPEAPVIEPVEPAGPVVPARVASPTWCGAETRTAPPRPSNHRRASTSTPTSCRSSCAA
jgi:hypothetical protein